MYIYVTLRHALKETCTRKSNMSANMYIFVNGIGRILLSTCFRPFITSAVNNLILIKVRVSNDVAGVISRLFISRGP